MAIQSLLIILIVLAVLLIVGVPISYSIGISCYKRRGKRAFWGHLRFCLRSSRSGGKHGRKRRGRAGL